MAEWINLFFSEFDLFFASIWNSLAVSTGVFFTPLFKIITFLGEKGILFFAAAIVLMLFKPTRKTGVCIFGAVALGAIITNIILKDLVARPRPFNFAPYDKWWTMAGQSAEDGFSFPSGHITACAAAALSMILSRGKKWIIPAIIVTALMCISRVYLVAHYSSDALVACIVGGASAVAAFFITKGLFNLFEKHQDKRFFAFILNFDITNLFKKEEKSDV